MSKVKNNKLKKYHWVRKKKLLNLKNIFYSNDVKTFLRMIFFLTRQLEIFYYK